MTTYLQEELDVEEKAAKNNVVILTSLLYITPALDQWEDPPDIVLWRPAAEHGCAGVLRPELPRGDADPDRAAGRHHRLQELRVRGAGRHHPPLGPAQGHADAWAESN